MLALSFNTVGVLVWGFLVALSEQDVVRCNVFSYKTPFCRFGL